MGVNKNIKAIWIGRWNLWTVLIYFHCNVTSVERRQQSSCTLIAQPADQWLYFGEAFIPQSSINWRLTTRLPAFLFANVGLSWREVISAIMNHFFPTLPMPRAVSCDILVVNVVILQAVSAASRDATRNPQNIHFASAALIWHIVRLHRSHLPFYTSV